MYFNDGELCGALLQRSSGVRAGRKAFSQRASRNVFPSAVTRLMLASPLFPEIPGAEHAHLLFVREIFSSLNIFGKAFSRFHFQRVSITSGCSHALPETNDHGAERTALPFYETKIDSYSWEAIVATDCRVSLCREKHRGIFSLS